MVACRHRIKTTFTRLLAALLLLNVTCTALAVETPVTLQLDWKPTAQFAGMLVARSRGFYQQEGLRVTIIPADATMATVPLVVSHPDTIGIAEADVLLVEHARGQPIKAFASVLQATPFSLFTLKTSGLTTIKSLKGKRIGLYGDGQKAIDVLLQFNGMTRRDVTIVTIPLTLKPLLSGQVDAMQGYVVDEGVQLQMEGHPVNVIPMSDNGYTSYAEVLFTTSGLLKENPQLLAGFLRATRAGWQYAIAHPDETAALIVHDYLPGGSVREQRESLRRVIPLLSAETGDDRIGMMQPASWARSIEMYNKYQFFDREVDATDLVDYSILQRVYGR